MKISQSILVISLFIFSSHASMGQTVKRKSAKTPNIIIFFPDDMGYGDLSCNGHPTIKTPNIDRLAFYGVKLTNFYSGSPACTASRYSLLTGRYPIRSGFDWVLYPKSDRGIHPNEITLAEVLKKAGYNTAIFGKWHLGSAKKEYLPLQNGFDEYIGLPYSNDMRPPNWSDLPLLHGNDTIELNPDQAKLTKLYTKKAIEFITKKRATPFFVYLPYAMPHVPLYASNEFKGKSKRGIYGDVVEEIDWSVGQIMAALQNNNLDKNTVVFFASDNGPWIIRGLDGGSSGLFKDGKGSTWEGGMRVPGIVYWPDHISQQINTSISSVRDIYVTAIKLANAELPNDRVIDGNNLSNILLQTSTGAPISPSQPFFFYGKSNELLAVRKDVWKLHVQTYSQTGKDYFAGKLPLLFNVNIDPSENHDVSDNHPKIVAELTKLLQQQEISTNEDSNFFDN